MVGRRVNLRYKLCTDPKLIFEMLSSKQREKEQRSEQREEAVSYSTSVSNQALSVPTKAE
jgi:hypothetical protein